MGFPRWVPLFLEVWLAERGRMDFLVLVSQRCLVCSLFPLVFSVDEFVGLFDRCLVYALCLVVYALWVLVLVMFSAQSFSSSAVGVPICFGETQSWCVRILSVVVNDGIFR